MGEHRRADATLALVSPLRGDTPEPRDVHPIEFPDERQAADGPSGAGQEPEDPAAPLWARFRGERVREARDALVLHYDALVRGIAGKLAGALPDHVELADLVQVGTVGLIDAVERFDAERGVRFETFAASRVRGAMLDELRALDWVPRAVRARNREIDRARERLEVRLGRSATRAEVAAEIGVGPRELRAMAGRRRVVSAEALADAGTVRIADLVPDRCAPDPVEIAEHRDLLRGLAVAVDALGERDREVVHLYYRENLTLAEVGRRLGVTESRVCQLHSRLVTRLRTSLREAGAS